MKRAAALLVSLLCVAAGSALAGGIPLDSLAITVRGNSREFAFTNTRAAFLYGETGRGNSPGWQGFHVRGRKALDDWQLVVDGAPLDRRRAERCVVYPDHLARHYPGGVVEEIRLVDSLAVVVVLVRTPRPSEVLFVPLVSDGRSAADFALETSAGMLQFARAAGPGGSAPGDSGLWVTLFADGSTPLRESRSGQGRFAPGVLVSGRRRETRFVIFAGGRVEGRRAAAAVDRRRDALFRARRDRMQGILDATEFRSSDARFDRALAWAKLSLDALMMDDVTAGIYAGLPWFANYWGRDTFISLPGATLVTGRFREARRIIASFAEFQQRDASSPDEGRIPNLVTALDKSYNTADGTPRMVMMAREYVLRSGDSAFVAEIYPAVMRSIDGAIRHRVDSLGFLTHADAETWMDAVGPSGAWSPRGNRANDIQALWSAQLDAGIWFATILGDVESAVRWDAARSRLRRAFPLHFVHPFGVADHLNADGSPDRQLRPNQIFAFPLLDSLARESALRRVVSELTYVHGVASLSQEDDGFHPYHQNPAVYPKDAAYHNGTVWTWLQGPVISELCRRGWQDLAWKVTANSVTQILDRGAVGTQSELLDAIPRPGEPEPRLSGTFSQAWNLAEFVRNAYDDYLGIRVDRFNHRMTIRPRLPAGIRFVRGKVDIGGRAIPVSIERTGEGLTLKFSAAALRKGGPAEYDLLIEGKGRTAGVIAVRPGRSYEVNVEGFVAKVLEDNTILEANTFENIPPPRPLFGLASPRLREGLASMRGPRHEVFDGKQMKRGGAGGRALLEADDPRGDDAGVSGGSGYTYPSHPALREGSLDVVGFSIREVDSLLLFRLRFRALSDPGWHPEYGFQLTIAAIALHRGTGGRREVGHNTQYVMPEGKPFDRLVLVGGGVRVEDESGGILAEYIPAAEDASDPLGNASTGEVNFSLPTRLFGRPDPSWRFTLLVGAQDDHGGAGLGEFRTVGAERGEWSGGGKKSAGLPNVYDELVGN